MNFAKFQYQKRFALTMVLSKTKFRALEMRPSRRFHFFALIAFILACAFSNTSLAIDDPSGPGKYVWETQEWDSQIGSQVTVSGEADSLAEALSAMRGVDEATAMLIPDQVFVDAAKKDLITRTYKAPPAETIPADVTPADFEVWASSEGGSGTTSSEAAGAGAIIAAGGCPHTALSSTSDIVTNGLGQRPQSNSIQAIQTWQFKYFTPRPPAENECQTLTPGFAGTITESHRTASCPVALSGGYVDVDDYQNAWCLNGRTGKIAYYANHAPTCEGNVGNPCNVSTGEKIESVVDYEGPTLSFVRTYRSNMFFETYSLKQLGNNWTHNYAATLHPDPYGAPLGLIRPDGSMVSLAKGWLNHYYATNGSDIQVRNANGGWTAYLPSGAIEIYRSYSHSKTMETRYRLEELHDAGGRITTVSYVQDDVIEKVAGPFGHAIAFTYFPIDENCEGALCEPQLDYILDPNGNQISFCYDAVDCHVMGSQLHFVEYQDLTKEEYEYNDPNSSYLLTEIYDENGDRFASFEYDAKHRATLSQHGFDAIYEKVTLAYDDVANTTTVTDAAGTETVYTFEDTTSMLRYVDKATNAGDSKFVDWSTEGLASAERRRTDKIDEEGNHTKYSYDIDHRTDMYEGYVDGQTPTYMRRTEYKDYLEDTSELPQTVETPSVYGTNKKTVTTTYHSDTRVPSSITISGFDPAGNAVTPRVTSFGNLNAYNKRPQEIDGPRPGTIDVTTIAYYSTDEQSVDCSTGPGGGRCGQLKSVTNAFGHITNFNEYFSDGRLKKMTDPNDLVTEYTYTPRGWLGTITVGARLTDYAYDDAGQIDMVSLPNGIVLDYEWNDAHLLESISDNDGNTIAYSYDSRGNRTGENLKDDPMGAVQKALTMSYDARNRLDTIQQGASTAADLDFDAVGNLEYQTDPNGSTTDPGYDGLNRLISALDATGTGNTIYGYDIHDNLTSVTAPNGANTTYVYDDLGNLLEESSRDRGKTLYGYDAAGNMTCKADGRYTSSYSDCGSVPQRWVYVYDALNRVDSIDYMATATVSPDVSFDYDGANEKGRLNLLSQEYASGEIIDTQYDYDLFGNLIEQRQYVPDSPVAPDPYVTEYQYDGNDQIEQITYPSGRVVDYVRNSAGRIQQIKSTSPIDQTVTTLVANVFYKPFGPPTSIAFNNGLFTSRFYDTAYRVTQAGLTDNVPALVDYHLYTLDSAGNIEQDTDLVNSANSRNYEYDVLHRLTDDTSIDTTPSLDTYVYDGNGNRQQRNSTHTNFPTQTIVYDTGNNKPNRLATFNGQAVSYDGAGNMLLNGRGDSFAYNAGNRLESIASNGDTLTALYNGVGELARTSTNPACPCGGCPTWKDYYHFAADGRALGMVQQSFDGWTGNPSSRIERDWIWLDNIPIAQIEESYDSSGNYVATKVTYLHADHLGTPRVGTDTTGTPTWSYLSDAFGKKIPGVPTGATVPLRMPGQIDLGVGGIYYNYFRDYDSNTGRYLESDPIGLDGGPNTYAYAYDNPLKFSDPSGLEVRLACRNLVGPPGQHCFVYVSCSAEGWSQVYSLFGDKSAAHIYGTGTKYAYDPTIQNGRDDPFSPDLRYNEPVSSDAADSCSSCSYEKSVRNRFERFPSSTVPYSPVLGPNSNTFARYLLGGGWPRNAPNPVFQAPGAATPFGAIANQLGWPLQ